MQKNLNKGAAEGYQLFPHTLAALDAFAVIMEKPPEPTDTRYEYRFHTSTPESSAEKNVFEDQAQGFTLLETAQILSQRVVITEKALPVQPSAEVHPQ